MDHETGRGTSADRGSGARIGGFGQLWRNVVGAPGNLRRALCRHGSAGSRRERSEAIVSNLFLHIHPARVHRWSLKPTFTLGLGVASAALFLLLAVTGIMLMLYYVPTTAHAYDSIKDIHFVVPGGRLLRNLHRWGAHLMVVVVILHMARVFFTRSYQAPREFNWVVGVVLLVLTLALGFTGYCLPWDQLGYWATAIGSSIAGSPVEVTDALNLTGLVDIGDFQRSLLLGSREIGDPAVLRFYWLHCVFLPLVALVAIALHLWRIRKDRGLSRPPDIAPEELAGTPEDEVADGAFAEETRTYTLMCVAPGNGVTRDAGPENTVPSWPHLLRAELAVFMGVLAVLLLASVFVDAPLKQAANPQVPENPAKAPWYFLGLQELVSYSAFIGGVAIPGLMVIVLASIPFLDREEGAAGRWPAGRERELLWRSIRFAAVTVLLVLVFVVRFGWLRNWKPDIDQIWILIVNPGTMLALAFAVHAARVLRGTGSTRLAAVSTFCCMLVAFVLLTYFGTVHRGPNWAFYWWPSQWQGS